jgi:hypothetical protein
MRYFRAYTLNGMYPKNASRCTLALGSCSFRSPASGRLPLHRRSHGVYTDQKPSSGTGAAVPGESDVRKETTME